MVHSALGVDLNRKDFMRSSDGHVRWTHWVVVGLSGKFLSGELVWEGWNRWVQLARQEVCNHVVFARDVM